MAVRFKRPTRVQSVLFNRDSWTAARARAWLTAHKMKAPKVDKTANYFRFRQAPPFKFEKGTFRTITFGRESMGVKAVIAVPKAKNPSYTPGKAERVHKAIAKAYPKEWASYLKKLKESKGYFDKFNAGKGSDWMLKHERAEAQADDMFQRLKKKVGPGSRRKNQGSFLLGAAVQELLKDNPRKAARIPSKLVSLGACLEVEFDDGTLYKPRGADLCASMSGRALWVIRRAKKQRFDRSCRLYSAFTDFEPDSAYKRRISDRFTFKKSRKVISVSYRSDKWSGKKVDYIHKFRRKPTAYCDDIKNPSIIRISGGNINIRPEGITG